MGVGAAAAMFVISTASTIYTADQQRKNTNRLYDIQSASTQEMAEWNAAISRGDADVARRAAQNISIQGNKDLALKVAQLQRLRTTTKVGFASRGVAVNTGSPLDHQVNITRAVTRDMKKISYNTKLNMMKAYTEAERYEQLAQAGLLQAASQVHYYEEAANATASNITATSFSNILTSAATYGSMALSNGGNYG